MPTGYTATVQDGEVTDFAEFAVNCARAFGALVLLRDDPGAEIPEEFKPSTYHSDALRKDIDRLTEMRSMNAEQIRAAWKKESDDARAYREEYRKKKALQQLRYETMLAKVKAWEPPTLDHVALKEFMVKQLADSIDFDCGGDYLPSLAPVYPDDWFGEQIKELEKSIERHQREHEKEVERTNGRTRWVRELRDSLAPSTD